MFFSSVIQRHNELRNVTAKLLSEVCANVEVKPFLLKFTSEDLVKKSTLSEDQASLDISARDFWINGQKCFSM